MFSVYNLLENLYNRIFSKTAIDKEEYGDKKSDIGQICEFENWILNLVKRERIEIDIQKVQITDKNLDHILKLAHNKHYQWRLKIIFKEAGLETNKKIIDYYMEQIGSPPNWIYLQTLSLTDRYIFVKQYILYLAIKEANIWGEHKQKKILTTNCLTDKLPTLYSEVITDTLTNLNNFLIDNTESEEENQTETSDKNLTLLSKLHTTFKDYKSDNGTSNESNTSDVEEIFNTSLINFFNVSSVFVNDKLSNIFVNNGVLYEYNSIENNKIYLKIRFIKQLSAQLATYLKLRTLQTFNKKSTEDNPQRKSFKYVKKIKKKKVKKNSENMCKEEELTTIERENYIAIICTPTTDVAGIDELLIKGTKSENHTSTKVGEIVSNEVVFNYQQYIQKNQIFIESETEDFFENTDYKNFILESVKKLEARYNTVD